jgi:hypothetical protein
LDALLGFVPEFEHQPLRVRKADISMAECVYCGVWCRLSSDKYEELVEFIFQRGCP